MLDYNRMVKKRALQVHVCNWIIFDFIDFFLFFIIEYIHKICPFYDQLHEIFAQKRSVNATTVVETSSENASSLIASLDGTENSVFVEAILNDRSYLNNIQTIPETVSETSTTINVIHPTNELSDARSSIEVVVDDVLLGNTSEQSRATKQTEKNMRKRRDGGSLATLIDLQEKRLRIEEGKIEKQVELERHSQEIQMIRAKNEVELKKLELEHQLKVKQMELESEERIAMAKLKMENDLLERLRKYEFNSNS